MITFEELHKRIYKQYPAVLKAEVLGENIFPLYIRANKTPEMDFAKRNRNLEALYRYSSHHHPFGYHIETEQVNRRQHGLQDEPVAFYFDTPERFTGYLDKCEEYHAFVEDVQLILQAFPHLQTWLAAHLAEVVVYRGKWPHLLRVAQYFLEHPLPGLFARELPLMGLGTKFVEQHKAILMPLLNAVLPPEAVDAAYTGLSQFEQRFGLCTDPPRIRFRWLDATLAERYTGGLHDLSLPLPDMAGKPWQVQRVFIVENKTNMLRADVFLTLPQMEGAMAIFGSGKAASLLSSVSLLKDAQVFYWGDMDAEGFDILDHLLQFFPHAKAFCMDDETLEAFAHQAVSGSGAPPRNCPRLDADQQQLYRRLCTENIRLEQEQITPFWVRQQLHRIS